MRLNYTRVIFQVASRSRRSKGGFLPPSPNGDGRSKLSDPRSLINLEEQRFPKRGVYPFLDREYEGGRVFRVVILEFASRSSRWEPEEGGNLGRRESSSGHGSFLSLLGSLVTAGGYKT